MSGAGAPMAFGALALDTGGEDGGGAVPSSPANWIGGLVVGRGGDQ